MEDPNREDGDVKEWVFVWFFWDKLWTNFFKIEKFFLCFGLFFSILELAEIVLTVIYSLEIVLKIFAWGFFGETKAPEATEEDVEAEHQTAALVLFGHHDDFRVSIIKILSYIICDRIFLSYMYMW